MKRITFLWNHLSLRWKWTLASGASIFLVFTIFSVILIVAMSQWMMQEEENTVNTVLHDITVFYNQRSPIVTAEDVAESRELVEQIHEKGQTIRLYNADGFELFSIGSEATGQVSVPFEPVQHKQVERRSSQDGQVLIGRSPIISDQFRGYAEVVHPLIQYESMRNYMILLSIILGSGGLLFSAVFAYYLAGKFVSPVVALGHAMRRTQKQDLQERLEIPVVQDEVGGLVVIFNEMMDELEASFRQQRQFVEDASHELRTPIQIIEGHLSLINRWGKKDPSVLEESLGISMQELERIKHLVNELLTLSRADREVAPAGNASEYSYRILEQLIERFKELYPEREIIFSFDENEMPVTLEKHHIEQIMSILLDNAIKYSEDSKRVEINAKCKDDSVVIQVNDQGIGIPHEDLPFIFDRFYRVDKARSREQGGNGLGLSIAKRLLSLYGGTISAESSLGEGTTITLMLPVSNQSIR
ncbi:HAMP domain-containing sensor histidine kinase [Jeotgalibacillus soli]|uniref:Signal transduction histidine-protein kinase ArlS n=1 Tax=Jeotgalibacillus soli TaxID=889306 RepID=A0A0C2R5G0_9BACL|nr:HAMP domain-containing histidine kinase [Jeotgalibacillus soli]KIL45490.1 histidine kinase [Jeotgalibacillus soli]